MKFCPEAELSDDAYKHISASRDDIAHRLRTSREGRAPALSLTGTVFKKTSKRERQMVVEL